MENKQSIQEFTLPGKSIGNFIKSLFTSADDKVVKYASAELGTLLNRLAKTKQFKPGQGITLNLLRNSNEYKKSLMTLGEDLSQKLYKKSFSQLSNAEKKEILKQTTTKLDDVLKKQLELTGKSISDDITKGALKGKNLAKAQGNLNKINRELQILEKKQTKKAVNQLIKNNLTLIGDAKAGAKILDKIKSNKITIIKNGQFYKITRDSAKNRPIKLLKLNKETIKKIGIYGASAATIIYLISTMYPDDEVAVVDENGNDIDEGGGDSQGGGNSQGGGLQYKNCTSFPFQYGCISPYIAHVQNVLGIKPAKGYFGPLTRKKLGGDVLDEKMYNNILRSAGHKGSVNDEPTNNSSYEQPTYGNLPTQDEMDSASREQMQTNPEAQKNQKNYPFA